MSTPHPTWPYDYQLALADSPTDKHLARLLQEGWEPYLLSAVGEYSSRGCYVMLRRPKGTV